MVKLSLNFSLLAVEIVRFEDVDLKMAKVMIVISFMVIMIKINGSTIWHS